MGSLDELPKQYKQCVECGVVWYVSEINCAKVTCGFINGQQLNPHISQSAMMVEKAKPSFTGCGAVLFVGHGRVMIKHPSGYG